MDGLYNIYTTPFYLNFDFGKMASFFINMLNTL